MAPGRRVPGKEQRVNRPWGGARRVSGNSKEASVSLSSSQFFLSAPPGSPPPPPRGTAGPMSLRVLEFHVVGTVCTHSFLVGLLSGSVVVVIVSQAIA